MIDEDQTMKSMISGIVMLQLINSAFVVKIKEGV